MDNLSTVFLVWYSLRAASAGPTARKHGPAQLYLPVEAQTGCGGQGHDHSASL